MIGTEKSSRVDRSKENNNNRMRIINLGKLVQDHQEDEKHHINLILTTIKQRERNNKNKTEEKEKKIQ